MSETLFFSNRPIKRTGWPRSFAINIVIFGNISKLNAWQTAYFRSKFSLNGVLT
jgi:hypothetical protein